MIDGILLLDKPEGKSTSFCARLIAKSSQTKAGHAGTLDPFATGLVTVLLGKATKLSTFLTDLEKTYEGEVYLGIKTATGDRDGEIIQRCDNFPNEKELHRIAESLVGHIELEVPAYSAVKKDGRQLYKYARDGEKIDLPTRTVEITSFEIDEIDLPRFRFTTTVSKGTYIRAVAEKIGEIAGCGAHLTELRRTRVGKFCVKDAVPMLEAMELVKSGKLDTRVLSMAEVLPFSKLALTREEAKEITLGRSPKLDIDNFDDGDIIYALHSAKLIAILKKRNNNGRAFEFIRVFARPEEIEN